MGFLRAEWLGHTGYTCACEWEITETRNAILAQTGVRNLFPSFFSFLGKLSSLFKMKNNNQMNEGRIVGNDK